LVSGDFALDGANPEAIAGGANKALVGREIVQFARAERLTGNRWRIAGLLRGRGGTEAAALAGAAAGSGFVLLDHRPHLLDPARLGPAAPATIAALGLADPDTVTADIVNPGITR